MSAGRQLDHIEAIGLGNAGARFVTYQGLVDETVMADAYGLLCHRHPVLLATVHAETDAYVLAITDRDSPDLVVVDGDERELKHELERLWDPTTSLCRAILVRGESTGILALRIDHSIADGRSSIALLWELWRTYVALLEGTTESEMTAGALPYPPSELMNKHFGDASFGGLPVAPVTARAASASAIDRRDLPLQGRIRLSTLESAGLRDRARAAGITMHGLVCGALLAAHRSSLAHKDDLVGMQCVSIIDFRDRVEPAVGATATTNFDGLHQAEVAVPDVADPVALGRQVKAQLDSAFSDLKFPPVDLAFGHPGVDGRLLRITVSNLGVLEPIRRARNAAVVGFGTVSAGIGPVPLYIPYTFDGCLHIGYVYSASSFGAADVEALIAAISKQIEELLQP